MIEQSPAYAALVTDADRKKVEAALLRYFQSRWNAGGEYRDHIEKVLAECRDSQQEVEAAAKEEPAKPGRSKKQGTTK